MKDFSFVHAADLHLGYSQYGLEARREDFDRVFQELVDKTIELKPDFMIIAGDLFHHARPSNVTLEKSIRNFSRLRENGIPVLAVDGSHDSAPNTITGTVLNPLDSAGLIHYLPRHEGACWKKAESCYVYGVPNFRTRQKTDELLPVFMEQNKPNPDPSLFNIFVFHMTIDLPSIKPPYIEAEASPALIPEGFNYYAGGHIHRTYKERFKTGLLVYSGCVETVDYEEAENPKGFYYVKVESNEVSTEFMELESPRKFIIQEHDLTGVSAQKITERIAQFVKEADQEGAIIVPVLKGILPINSNRSEIDITKIRSIAERALFVHPVVLLQESQVSDEVVRSIFESGFKDMKTKAFEYFLQVFSESYDAQKSEKIARVAVNLIESLAVKNEEKVKQNLEELLH